MSRAATPLETAQAELNRLRTEKGNLLGRFTAQHPDVIKINRDIAAAETNVERLKAAGAAGQTVPPDSSGASQVAQSPRMAVRTPRWLKSKANWKRTAWRLITC